MPTVNAAIEQLARIGLVQEITGKRRGRVYAYRDYLRILNDSADFPPR